jgi:hypothetical protein
MYESVQEWLENNASLVSSIYKPLSDNEYELMGMYDDVFRDSIRENTKELLYSLVSIEFSRATGESAEEFYASIDSGELYDFIARLEEYYED